MTPACQKRLNQAMTGLFISSALVIALVVAMQGRAEGRSWLSSISVGAIAGVLISYATVLVLMLFVWAVRRVSSFLQK
ncbi:MAG: hypothetical protein U1G08_17585 [Verrucomicrobiota bacterium]